ncbi:MAG: GAF domain-containing protein [Chitinivibrionales bacterium]|nr:GAF domain-containing protein [Chitinivibrionales bacterium]
MNQHIILVGSAPQPDIELLRSTAAAYNFVIEPYDNTDFQSPNNLPWGFISYLPCKRETIVDFLSRIPVGLAQDIPFFQNIQSDSYPSSFEGIPISGVFKSPLTFLDVCNMMTIMSQQVPATRQSHSLAEEVIRYRREKNQLLRIGTALSSQNDPDILLDFILAESRAAVGADAGSLYIREQVGPGGAMGNRLRFKIAQNDSVAMQEKTREFTIPISDNTISGYVALTGDILNVGDVYRLDESVSYKWGKGWDKRFGYRMKSMLTVPLKNLGGEIVGVLQLMNKKVHPGISLTSSDIVEREVVSFTHSDEEFVFSIAALAAVSIERVQLYQNIQAIFEGFLSSSTAAIDERDRVTAGHSKRVAGYAMAFVDAINDQTQGKYADIYFSPERKRQFIFAALLHDYGKIGVPEELLTKECRLRKGEMEAIATRAEIVKLHLKSGTRSPSWSSLDEIDKDLAFIEKINKAGFLADDDFRQLEKIRKKRYRAYHEGELPFITEKEWEHLSIRKGNLTATERELINSHAQATRRILSKIPWTKELKQIPSIACHHHEKLDGSGYPDGLKGGQIDLECRILAVVDIYEALVAQDRPYKPRMPAEKAIAILRAEAQQNHLDSDIVEFFVEKGLHKIFLHEVE